MSTLIELTNELGMIKRIMDDQSLSEEQINEILNGQLADLQLDTKRKVENYVGLIHEYELAASAAKAMSERLAQRSSRCEKQSKSLRDRLEFALQQSGIPPVQTVYGTVGVVRVGGKQKLDITDESLIPSNFIDIETKMTVNKEAVRKAIEDGEIVPGAELLPRGTRLSIGGSVKLKLADSGD